jgi:integrase
LHRRNQSAIKKMPTAKLTDQTIRTLPAPPSGTTFYADEKDKRLQIAVGTRKRVWYATATQKGRFLRKRLGEWPHVNANEARRLHSSFIGDVSKGEDPRDKKAGTLSHWLDRYIEQKEKRGKLRSGTAAQYKYFVEKFAAQYLHYDLKVISRSDMEGLHRGMSDKPYAANQTIRILKAVFRFASRIDDVPDPTRVVDLYVEKSRTSKVGPLSQWYVKVMAQPNEFRRAFLLTVITTGLRRSNVEQIRWADVNLDKATLAITLTKAGRAITLPLSRQIVAILRDLPRVNEWVFFSASSKSGHIAEPKGDAPGSIHDLRREFATACTAVGIPYSHQKLLLDHTIPDITGQYIQETKVDLRVSAQRVVDYLFEEMTGGKIVPFAAA